MKHFILILIYIIPITSHSQTIGISHSMNLWGQTESITSIHYMSDTMYISYSKKNIFPAQKPTITFAKKIIGYKNTDLLLSISTRPKPVYPSSQWNFLVRYKILDTTRFSFYYVHFSNGFGLFREINPGIDFFAFGIKF